MLTATELDDATVKSKIDAIVKELIGQELAARKKAIEEENDKNAATATKKVGEILRGASPYEYMKKNGSTEIVDDFARVIRSLAIAKGDVERATGAAKEIWKGEIGDRVSKALAAGEGTAGGFLIPPTMADEVIEFLRPMSAIRKLNPTIVPLDTGTLPIPKITGGATAAYTGENTNITATEETFGDVVLSAKELAALVPISNKLLQVARPSVDAMVRDDLIAALAQRSDLAFIRGDGTSNTPRGLRNLAAAANIAAITGGNTVATIVGGLGAAMLALMNANVRMLRPGWIMAPRTYVRLITLLDANNNFVFRSEMAGGMLWGYPYAITTQVPINLYTSSIESELTFADFADVVIGERSTIEIEASNVAAYVDSAGATIAAFSRNQTVIRAIESHDINTRHAESIAIRTEIDWVPA